MKRNRADPAPPQTPAKTPRRYASPSAPHQKLPQKPQQLRAAAAAAAAAVEDPPPPAPTPPGESPEAAGGFEWALLQAGWEEAAWSTWGVAEEALLGWFPFADEHFRAAGAPPAAAGALWEDDETSSCSSCCWCCYHDDDIWHLQHIHDVPKH